MGMMAATTTKAKGRPKSLRKRLDEIIKIASEPGVIIHSPTREFVNPITYTIADLKADLAAVGKA